MMRDYGWLAAAIVIGSLLDGWQGMHDGLTYMVAMIAAIRLVHAERRIRRLEGDD